MDIGKRVRAAREAREMTQEELARQAGIPLNRVGRIETGAVKDPHYSTLSRIAGGLGVPIGELLEEQPVPLADAPKAGRPADEAEQRRWKAGVWIALLNNAAGDYERRLARGDSDLGELRSLNGVATDLWFTYISTARSQVRGWCQPDQRDALTRAEERMREASKATSAAFWAKFEEERGRMAPGAVVEFEQAIKASRAQEAKLRDLGYAVGT